MKLLKLLFLTFCALTCLAPLNAQEDCCQDCDDECDNSSLVPEVVDYEAAAEEAEESVEDDDPPTVLDLPTAINLALYGNRTLANAADNIVKAQLGVDLSESAFDVKFSPGGDAGYIGGGGAGTGATIGCSLNICKKFTCGTRVSVRPYITKDANRHHNGIQAKIIQPLLRGFGSEFTLAPVFAAKFAYRNSYRSAYLSGVDMIMRIVTAMYNIIKLEKLLVFDQEVQQRLTRFYQAIKVKERIGMADSLDVYRTETELKQGEESINNSLEQLQDARDRLREMLALPLGKNIEVNLSIEYSAFEADAEQSIETALINRVEIIQANDRLTESYRLCRLAKMNTLPDLDLVLDFSNIGSDEVFTRAFTNRNDSRWGVGFITTDFDRTAQEIAYQQSLLNNETTRRSVEQTQDSVILDVKRAIRALQRASQRIAIQEKQIHLSEGGLRLAKIKFDRNLANNFDVIQAEKTLKSARAAHLNAIIEHKIGEYKFLASIGLLVDKPQFCQ